MRASSDAPAWSSPVAGLHPQLFDQRLRALAAPLPTDLVVGDDQDRRLVVVVPAGTTVTATATCAAAGPTSGRVAVDETGSTDLRPGTLRPDQRSEAAADCPGTATARLLPDGRVATLDGPADVVLVDVSGVAGTASYQVQLR